MISKNFIFSTLIHLSLATGLIALVYHKKNAPAYQPFELQLDSVHVHHYDDPVKQKKSVSDSQKPVAQPVKAENTTTTESSSANTNADDKKSSGSNAPANEVSRYLGQMIQIINRQKFYPRLSLLNEETGTVQMKVTLNASGHVEQAEIKSTSGFERLDAAALKTLQSISTFPALPAELGQSITITVPIRYEVNPDH